jgi:ABC-type branched-subunit amino acid transport system substrate-binding protein
MTSSNSSSPGPPLWAIRLCKWLWRVQGRFWRLIFGGFVAEVLINIIINLIANVSLASQPLGVLQQAALINLMLQHAAITFTIAIIIAAFEFVIYFGSHIPLPTTKVAAPLPFPVPKRFLPPWWQKALSWILSALLVVTIMIWAGAAILHKAPPAPDRGIGIVAGSNGLGICNGSCFFDANRINGKLKQEAARSASTGNLTAAYQYWDWAANEDTTDAEAKIFLADTHILLTKTPHMTFVVVVPLTGDETQIDEGRDILQGAFVRQKEYNDAHPTGPQIYLLIANMGGQDSASQQTVASRILQAAHMDSTLVGVTGLPFGSTNLINTLSQNNIPMTSMAPLSAPAKIPYFFSVAPSLQDEAQAAASYITNTLHAGRIFVTFESGDTYSTALKNAFVDATTSTLAGIRPYPGGSKSSLSDIALEAISDNADLIYFAGPPADASTLLASMHGISQPPEVMGGDIIYQSIHAPASDRANFNGFLFSAFSYPDEWSLQHLQQPAFISDYWQTFDPDKQHAGNPYTYSRAGSDTILSYDALSLLTSASDIVLFKEKLTLTAQILWAALNQFTPDNMLQGVSGQVSFMDASSTPYKKAILILSIQPGGTRSLAVQSGSYSCASSCYKGVSG